MRHILKCSACEEASYLRRSGHFGGRFRELFMDAVDAYVAWNDGAPEPTVVLEANYEFEGNPGAAERNAKKKDRVLTVSQVCGLLWNCTDILPSSLVEDLEGCDIYLGRRTYACAARTIKGRIR